MMPLQMVRLAQSCMEGVFDIQSKYADLLTVSQVGLSRIHTAENRRPRGADAEMTGLETRKTVTDGDPYGLDTQRTITNGTNGRLFTADELASAMTQSTLKASRREGE